MSWNHQARNGLAVFQITKLGIRVFALRLYRVHSWPCVLCAYPGRDSLTDIGPFALLPIPTLFLLVLLHVAVSVLIVRIFARILKNKINKCLSTGLEVKRYNKIVIYIIRETVVILFALTYTASVVYLYPFDFLSLVSSICRPLLTLLVIVLYTFHPQVAFQNTTFSSGSLPWSYGSLPTVPLYLHSDVVYLLVVVDSRSLMHLEVFVSHIRVV